MISSVQNIQTSINENVIGMVKGISDNLNPVVNTLNKMNTVSPSNNPNQPSFEANHQSSTNSLGKNHNVQVNPHINVPKMHIDRRDVIAIDKTILNTDDMVKYNFLFRNKLKKFIIILI